MLHNLEVQKKVLKEEALEIREDASKEEVEGLKRHIEVHENNLNVASVEEMLSWVRSVIFLRKIMCKIEHQDTPNMLNARENYNALFECVIFLIFLREHSVIGLSVNLGRRQSATLNNKDSSHVKIIIFQTDQKLLVQRMA